MALPGLEDDLTAFGSHTKLPKPLGVQTAQLMRIQSAGGAPFTVDDAHASKFKGLLDDLEAAGYRIDPGQSGGYNPRNIAGTNKPSNHAFGRAIDINWTNNARGTQGNIPPELARSLAQKHGLRWGGDWKNPDPMHFEVAGPDEHSPHPHTHGPAQSTPQVASFAQRSPKPMAEDGGFFSNLMDWANTPIGEARRKTQPIRDRYADGEGNLNFTTEEFLAKYPGLNKPGIREQIPAMLDVYKMGRDLNRAAIDEPYTPRPATWGHAAGEGLKTLGAVLTARHNPQMGMQMAQGIGADWRANNDMRQKLALQSALQQAQSLTTASDAAIKGAMERLEKRRQMNALSKMAGEPIPYPEAEEGATALQSGTTGVGGVSASPIPVDRGTLPDVGAQPQATQTQTQPVAGGAAPSGRQPVVAPQGQLDPSQRKAKVFAMDPSTKGLSDFYQKEYELRSAPEREAAVTTAREGAKTQAEIAERNMKLGETAKKMTGLFNKLEEHATEPGMGHVIGPFDNNPWLGHWVQQMNPFAASSSLRDRIQADATALTVLGKSIIREKGEGTFTEGDQKVLADAVGNLLNARNEEEYLKAVEAARERFSTITGVQIPRRTSATPPGGGTSAGQEQAATAAAVAQPAPEHIQALRANQNNPAFVAAFERRFGPAARHLQAQTPSPSTMEGF